MDAVGASGGELGRTRASAILDASTLTAWAAATCAFVAVVSVASWRGAYFPSAWGFCALVACWVAAVVLLLESRPALSPMQLTSVFALTGLVAWMALSIIWSDDRPQSVLEVERGLVYVASLLAMILVLRNIGREWILGGAVAGITMIAAYALSTRLLTAPGGELDSISLNRLARPIGYWNGLAILTVLGMLVALGFAARGRTALSRSSASGALPLLVTTLYFTYSRGGWLALITGLLVTTAAVKGRSQFLVTALALAPVSALAVGFAATSNALTGLEAPNSVIESEGRRLALTLIALMGISAVVGAGLWLAESKLRPTRTWTTVFGASVTIAALAFVAVVLVRFGGPAEMARDAYRSFTSNPPASTSGDLNKRLFSLHNKTRVEHWREAWHDYEAHPLLGSGAGSYEQYWLRHRESSVKVRDAHSLYMEVLAELGPVGVALLALSLGVPLIAGLRQRHRRLMPAVLGAYVAYLVHAGVDWDWEIPAVTLVALLLGATLLASGREGDRSVVLRPPVTFGLIGLVVAVGAFSVVGLVGNRALAESQTAVNSARWREAEREARTAIRWAPWAAHGWQALGNAQLGLGREAEARASLLKAARKDPRDWSIWYDLAIASSGAERRRAFLRAAQLNPLNPNIEVLRDLGYGRGGTRAAPPADKASG